jgi:hypothetical protein
MLELFWVNISHMGSTDERGARDSSFDKVFGKKYGFMEFVYLGIIKTYHEISKYSLVSSSTNRL